MPLSLQWSWKVWYTCIQQTHNSTKWSQTSGNDPEETHTCSTNQASMHAPLATKVWLHNTVHSWTKYGLGRQAVKIPFTMQQLTYRIASKHSSRKFPSWQIAYYWRSHEHDPIHSAVYRMTLNGWPDRVHDVPHLACHFWSLRDELTIEDGVLLKGKRVLYSTWITWQDPLWLTWQSPGHRKNDPHCQSKMHIGQALIVT